MLIMFVMNFRNNFSIEVSWHFRKYFLAQISFQFTVFVLYPFSVCPICALWRVVLSLSCMALCSRMFRVLRDFIGQMTVRNVLANVTLLAEIVDCMLVG